MLERLHNPYKYLFWGLVFVLGGVLWRLALRGWFDLSWKLFLPGLLIIFGLVLLISGFLRHRPSPAPDSHDGSPKEERP